MEEKREGLLTVEEWDEVEASGREAWGALAFALARDPAFRTINRQSAGAARGLVSRGQISRAYAWGALESLEAQAAAGWM